MGQNQIAQIKLRLNRVDFYYLIIIFSIGAEYISRILFTFPIFSILGAYESLKRVKITSKNLFYIGSFTILNIGIFIKRLLFTPELSFFVNVFFVIQTIFFEIFIISYLRKKNINKSFLLLTSFLYFPHLLGLMTGLVDRGALEYGVLRFGGFTGDPNYLSIDIIFSLISQVFIIFAKYSKRLSIVSAINLIGALYILTLTASRTGIMAFLVAIVLLLAAQILEESSFYKMVKFLVVLAVFGCALVLAVNNIDRVAYIYYRIFETEGGGGMIENERFLVWALSYDLIQSSDLFNGYGRAGFLANQYSFLSHNVFLDIGIVYGKYTFYGHVLFFLLGIILFVSKFVIGKYKFGINTETYFVVFCIAELVMMNSISVSDKYIYWFLMGVVLVYGYVGENLTKRRSI